MDCKRNGILPQRELFEDQSIHYHITQSIAGVYSEVTGEEMSFNTRFTKALKTFLAGWPGTAQEFLDRYRECLLYGTRKFSSQCKLAANPVYLCEHWNEVSAEIAKLKADEESEKPRTSTPFTKTL